MRILKQLLIRNILANTQNTAKEGQRRDSGGDRGGTEEAEEGQRRDRGGTEEGQRRDRGGTEEGQRRG